MVKKLLIHFISFSLSLSLLMINCAYSEENDDTLPTKAIETAGRYIDTIEYLINTNHMVVDEYVLQICEYGSPEYAVFFEVDVDDSQVDDVIFNQALSTLAFTLSDVANYGSHYRTMFSKFALYMGEDNTDVVKSTLTYVELVYKDHSPSIVITYLKQGNLLLTKCCIVDKAFTQDGAKTSELAMIVIDFWDNVQCYRVEIDK